MRFLLSGLALASLAAASLVAACGDANKPSGFVDPAPDADADAAVTGDGAEPILPAGDSSDGPSCTTCSSDLHSVITCGDNPQLVQTCAGEDGCGPSGCIAACDAAAANKSSIGCDYYAIPSDAWNANYQSGGAAGNCFAAFVSNTWSTPMKITLVWKGKTIDATPYSYIPKGSGNAITYQPVPLTGVPPDNMAIVFLNQTAGGGGLKVNCPVSVKAAVENEDMVIHGTAIGNAMEIKTSVPAVVYDVYPYGGAKSYISSATLLLPTTVWDTNYIAATMAEQLGQFPSGIDLVGKEDNTQVTLLPSIDITAGTGVAAAKKGVPVTYTVNKGQTVHIMQTDGAGNSLSGSVVQSTKPIGVWGEHFCMNQPNPPKWRIIGVVKGTTLSYDPPVPAGPKTLTVGQLVEFDGPTAFYVKSQDDQHPFYLAAHRPGGDCDAAHQEIPPVQALGHEYAAVGNETTDFNVGGPETVNVVPPAQFLTSYLFFTDPTYGYTDLALVRAKAADGTYKDVTLDCLGKVTGWQPIGASPYQYTHVDVKHAGANVGACDNGLHTMKSAARVGLTVWGYDSASSYAYPAGASVKPINTVVVPPVPN